MTTEDTLYDLLIIGGGINGAGLARDAAGRGLKVILVEQDDLAAHTSSASTKLIHGGLRYLEQYDFMLVRKALAERDVLLAAAPHIIRPLEFILPHQPHLRPAWMIRAGLFLYDHLARRKQIKGSRGVNLATETRYGAPLAPSLKRGFAYWDCQVADARLVVLNAMDAAERGAVILTRSRCVFLARQEHYWLAKTAVNGVGGQAREIRARAVINSAGAWVSHIVEDLAHLKPRGKTRLIKGSHLILDRLYDGDHAYLFQNEDGRVIFTIPFEADYTLLGTTDEVFHGDAGKLAITEAETAYLLRAVAPYFRTPPQAAQIRGSYAGVRALYDDGASAAQDITRDYVLELDRGKQGNAPPIMTIFGGKITTYRRLAEDALKKLLPAMGITQPRWTKNVPLPGGDLDAPDFAAFLARLQQQNPWLPPALAMRLARSYGSRVAQILGKAKSMADLGQDFGHGLTEAEIDYLIQHEFARTADDILWRRSKHTLRLTQAQQDALAKLTAA